MDWSLLRESVEKIIKGLEVINDVQGASELVNLLNNFTERQINKLQTLQAQQENIKN